MMSLSSLLIFACALAPLTTAVIQCPMAYGYFANPYSKYMFVHCLNFIPYTYPCPYGTVFYQYLQRCDYDIYAPAPPTVPATTTTTTSPTTRPTTTTTTVATTTTTTTVVMTTTTTSTTVATTTTTTTIATTTTTTTIATTTTTTGAPTTTQPSTTTAQVAIHQCLKGNPCLNGGSCQPAGKGDFFCLCTKNYYGTRCEHAGESTDLSLLESIIHGNNNNYEHTVEHVLNRNNWTDILAVVDVTGSMQPCAASIYRWMQLSNDRHENVRYYVFFNDGDDKPNSAKVIGSTGGIYGIAANDSNKVLATMQAAMKNGDGGDIPENDVEAILRGIELCPQCENIVHIADNGATPRDLKLLGAVNRPVKVLTCRVDHDGVNPALLNIADKTGGSLHTIDEDIIRLAGVPIGGRITIGRRTYQRTSTGFVLV